MRRRSVDWAAAFALTGALGVAVALWFRHDLTNALHLIGVGGIFLLTFGLSLGALALGELTEPGVRVMDAIYVIASCVAAAIALATSHDRSVSLQDLADDALRARIAGSPVAPTPADLAGYIEPRVGQFCVPLGAFLEPDFCSWSKDLSRALREPTWLAGSAGQVRKALDEMQSHLWDGTVTCYPTSEERSGAWRGPLDSRTLTPSVIFGLPEGASDAQVRWFLCDEGQFAGTIRSTLQLMADIQAPHSPPPAESKASGELRTLLWPAIFAFALALRLTKAVADVTRWANTPIVG